MSQKEYTLQETYIILNKLSNASDSTNSGFLFNKCTKININKQKNFKLILILFREIFRRNGHFFKSKNIFRIPTNDLTNKEIIENLQMGKKINNFNNFQIASALKYLIREIYDGITNLYLLKILYTCEIDQLKEYNIYSIFLNICTPFDREIFENLCELFLNLHKYKNLNELSTEAICIIFTPVFIGSDALKNLNFGELKRCIEIFKLIISKKL